MGPKKYERTSRQTGQHLIDSRSPYYDQWDKIDFKWKASNLIFGLKSNSF